jgi:hypothetical protein
MSTELIVQKVKALTSTEKWGSARSDMAALIQLIQSQDHANALTETLVSRLLDQSDSPISYKAVELADYLVLNADQGLAVFVANQIRSVVEQMARHSDKEGTRVKATAVIRIISDPNEFEQQRTRASQVRAKFSNQAISSSQTFIPRQEQPQQQQYHNSFVQEQQSSSLRKQWSKESIEDAQTQVNVRISKKKSKGKKQVANSSEANVVSNSDAPSMFGPGMVIRSPVEAVSPSSNNGQSSSFGFIGSSAESENVSSGGFDFINQSNQNQNLPSILPISNASATGAPQMGFLTSISGKGNSSSSVSKPGNQSFNSIDSSLIEILNSPPIPRQSLSIDELLGKSESSVISNDDLVSSAAKDPMELDDDEYDVVHTLNGERKLKKKAIKESKSQVKVDADPWNNGLVNLNALNAPVIAKKDQTKPKRPVDPRDPFSGL